MYSRTNKDLVGVGPVLRGFWGVGYSRGLGLELDNIAAFTHSSSTKKLLFYDIPPTFYSYHRKN